MEIKKMGRLQAENNHNKQVKPLLESILSIIVNQSKNNVIKGKRNYVFWFQFSGTEYLRNFEFNSWLNLVLRRIWRFATKSEGLFVMKVKI